MMKKTILGLLAFLALSSPALADPLSPWAPSVSSTLAMTSATTAYSAGQLIATSATAGSVVNPSFTIPANYQSALIPRVRLSTNDATSTGWGGVTIQVDLWALSPTWTNGDRAAWSPATGSASHLGSYTCVMAGTSSAVYGDGTWAECGANVGNFSLSAIAPNSTIYWSLEAITASGVTGATKTFTLKPEFIF